MALLDELTEEHHAIDHGLEVFVAGLARGTVDVSALTMAFATLRRHIYLEEEFLFPPVRAAGLMMPVLVMIREHGALWALMDAIEAAVEQGPGESSTVSSQCADLLAALASHNAKEEPVIYPHADVDLTPDAADALWEFLDSGVMPTHWTPQALPADRARRRDPKT